ncbi:MAG: pilus assembly protein PilM [Pseudomonadota bacterium]
MVQRILGLDIGSYSVKAAVLERSFKSFGFVEFYEQPIVYSDALSQAESISIAVHSLIDDHNLSWDLLSCSVPGELTASRIITFPFSGTKRINEAVKFEIESFVPFSLEQMIVDHTVLIRSKEMTKVMIFYVEKKEFVKWLDALVAMRLDPRYLCAEGVELVNLINMGMVPPEGAFAIIDMGHEKSTIALCHGRRLGLVRAITIGGKRITERIAKLAGVPLEEAEKLKIEMGQLLSTEDETIDELSKVVHQSIREVLDEFLLYLRQTFFAYRDMEDMTVEGVFLTGGTSRLPGIDHYLSDALKLNVAYLNATDFHFSRISRGDAYRHVIPPALSLALKGVAAGESFGINFRKGEFAFKGDVEELGGSLKRFFIFALIVIFLAIVNFGFSYYYLKGKANDINEQFLGLVKQALPDVGTGSLSSPTAAMAVLKSKKKTLTDKIQKLEAASGLSPLEVLREMSTVMPGRDKIMLDIDSINIKNDRASLSGRVSSFEAVDRVKTAFEESPLLQKVQSGNVRKGVKDEIKFDMSMDFEKNKR